MIRKLEFIGLIHTFSLHRSDAEPIPLRIASCLNGSAGESVFGRSVVRKSISMASHSISDCLTFGKGDWLEDPLGHEQCNTAMRKGLMTRLRCRVGVEAFDAPFLQQGRRDEYSNVLFLPPQEKNASQPGSLRGHGKQQRSTAGPKKMCLGKKCTKSVKHTIESKQNRCAQKLSGKKIGVCSPQLLPCNGSYKRPSRSS